MSAFQGPDGLYARSVKRSLDLILATVGGILTLPIQILLALLVKRNLGAPVFFTQERPGRDGEPFVIVKFRTMIDKRGPDGALLPDAERLPAFGRFLRTTSLDELPELYNVVRGDMSLVGPRPLLTKYLALYTSRQNRRHIVRPGITGWAQVNGRNNAGWREKLEMDVWYTENVSLALDLKILWRTIGSVIRRQDVSQDGHATAPEFMGDGLGGDPDAVC